MKAYAERGKMTNCDACVNYEYDEDYEKDDIAYEDKVSERMSAE